MYCISICFSMCIRICLRICTHICIRVRKCICMYMTRNRSWNRNRSRNRNRIQIICRNRNRLQIFRFRNPVRRCITYVRGTPAVYSAPPECPVAVQFPLYFYFWRINLKKTYWCNGGTENFETTCRLLAYA